MEGDFFMTKTELQKLWETRLAEFKASGSLRSYTGNITGFGFTTGG